MFTNFKEKIMIIHSFIHRADKNMMVDATVFKNILRNLFPA